jgi:ornithine cyclodeaminase/alanine dehydrogenase-like protein (mu-crystallin family)
MLIINEKDIENTIEPFEMVSAIERAYLIQDKTGTNIPDRMHLDNGENSLLVMPGFIESVFGTKVVSVFPGNSQKGKPVINGAMILNDVETGEPLALINANKLTAMRTGAVGATAVKYLASFMAQTLGIIGAGMQAYHQAIMISGQRPFRKLIICDSNPEKAESLKEHLEDRLENIKIEVTENPNQLVMDSDVVVTATSSTRPVFNVETDKLGIKTFIAIGSYKPNMQEIPFSIYKAINKVYVDTLHAKDESGDIKNPLQKGLIKKSDIVPFRKLLTSEELLKETSITLFKSVGMSLFDLTFAELIYKNAQEKGLGTEVEF